MATKQKTISTSYCRNRGYSQRFEWTYDLNYDVYKCYISARNNPKFGYMKRMKEEWDNLHPELSHFNQKQKKLTELKHELKVTSELLRNKKLSAHRKSINKKVQLNQKTNFRKLRNKKIDIKITPSKADIETLWSSIWAKPFTHKENAKWLKAYQVDIETFKEILTRMKNNGAPGPDKINAYAIKK